MEKGNKRPLAYKLANNVPENELTAISGGTNQVKNISYQISNFLSGGIQNRADRIYDANKDA